MAVSTVLGQVEVVDLGPVLPHEHLFINLMPERRSDGLIVDEQLVIDELATFSAQGGRTIVDLSSNDLTSGSTLQSAQTGGTTRDPANVQAAVRVSEMSGLHVVLGTGHYRDPYLNVEYIDSHTVDEIAEDLVRDLEIGFPGTNVQAGVIGEVGSDKWFISAREERSFRAAARASNRTNAGIYTHAARWPVGLAQLDLLEQEGAQPSRIAVGHVDTVASQDYATSLAARGTYLGIDTMYETTPRAVEQRLELVMSLVEAGYADRVLLSHDVCVMSQLTAGGGPGFGHVLGAFRSRLLETGLESELIELMTITNPARFLSGH